MSKVLRSFDYSFDGITALKANIGDDIDFGDMTSGLEAEGYVEAGEMPVVVDSGTTVEPVVEPVVETVVEPVVTQIVEPVIEPVVASPAPPPTRKRR